MNRRTAFIVPLAGDFCNRPEYGKWGRIGGPGGSVLSVSVVLVLAAGSAAVLALLLAILIALAILVIRLVHVVLSLSLAGLILLFHAKHLLPSASCIMGRNAVKYAQTHAAHSVFGGMIVKRLPQEFLTRMQAMLGEEYDTFLALYDHPAFRGVRLNPLKCSQKVFDACFGPMTSPAPFSPFSYYYTGEETVGTSPLHHAGAVYSQEPSAASAVTVLDPRPGDRVLDLCAAPGGKSTQIAALLQGEGLLWSNEPVRSRAQVLLSNLERLGVRNGVVSCAYPEDLCPRLPGWFDKVLVDAPCSGEGMFRRDDTAVAEWTPQAPAACAQRQRHILHQAAGCLREGGVLVYSTCTFSVEENEDTVRAFLAEHPDFVPEAPGTAFGRPAFGVENGLRIFPMDRGEGHFVARFRRVSGGGGLLRPYVPPKPGEAQKLARDFLQEAMPGRAAGELAVVNDRVLLLPPGLPELSRLPVLRAGVEVGEVRGRRLEPAHALFMSARPEECARVLELSLEDPRLAAFLHGEEISCEGKGYTAVSVCGAVTGFGKAGGGVLKNKYPKGLRTLR